MTYTLMRNGVTVISTKPAQALKGERGAHGYQCVSVYMRKKRHRFLVHRLVARAFVDGYAENLTVNHINGDKNDNRASNLEWVTLAENTAKQWQTGLVDLRGDKHPGRRINSAIAAQIRERAKRGEPASRIAEDFGVSNSLVWLIRDGKRWASTI